MMTFLLCEALDAQPRILKTICLTTCNALLSPRSGMKYRHTRLLRVHIVF